MIENCYLRLNLVGGIKFRLVCRGDGIWEAGGDVCWHLGSTECVSNIWFSVIIFGKQQLRRRCATRSRFNILGNAPQRVAGYASPRPDLQARVISPRRSTRRLSGGERVRPLILLIAIANIRWRGCRIHIQKRR